MNNFSKMVTLPKYSYAKIVISMKVSWTSVEIEKIQEDCIKLFMINISNDDCIFPLLTELL